MTGETDPVKLLSGMSPRLDPGEFVFCSFTGKGYGECADLQPVASVQEAEGLTLVIPRAQADANALEYDAVFCCITLEIHSSLQAVGLTAAVSGALADHGISANVIAGFYHDYVFVPVMRVQEAMTALDALTRAVR